MALDPISAVADLVGNVIDRIWPDATEAAKAKLALAQMAQNGELAKLTADTDLLKGQLEVDKAEAQNPSLFIGGGRPFIIWVCGIVLACAYIPKTLAFTGIWIWACIKQGMLVPAPPLDISDVLGVVLPMLGIGGLHTYEKIQGVATTAIASKK